MVKYGMHYYYTEIMRPVPFQIKSYLKVGILDNGYAKYIVSYLKVGILTGWMFMK